jgi:hypothetical protein
MAAGGGEASIGVWNTYNRVPVAGVVSSSVAAWPVASGTRVFAGSATFRATMVSGLAEDCLSGVAQDYMAFDLATSAGVAIGFRSLAPLGSAQGYYYDGGGYLSSINVHARTSPFVGLGYWVGLEICTNFTSSFANGIGSSTYIAYDWRY